MAPRLRGRSLQGKIWFNSVVTEENCWIWQRAKTVDGYGMLSVAGVMKRAHRVAYETHRGEIPDGLHTDHLCRQRDCVNPWHLELVTNRQNVLRGEGTSAIHARKTHCIRGHEFTPENTTIQNSRGGRRCRACTNEQARARRRKRSLEGTSSS